jgi:predicted AAA+ superfamily ATPase
LFYEDIKELAHVQEVAQIEVLAELLKTQVGQLLNRTSLSKKIQVSVPTISRWIETLERFYYCFSIKPWYKNISRSLIKEPKIYLWNWSDIENIGLRFENFIACHLLKSIHLWQDIGMGKHDLYYLRNKDQREVDFLITKNNKPWILVEAKNADNQRISSSLMYFHTEAKAEYAFQFAKLAEYEDISVFKKPGVWIVSAKTLLSQLV